MVPDPGRLMDGIVEEFRVLHDLAVESVGSVEQPAPSIEVTLDLRPREPRPDHSP